jgi:hypothetical protein
MLLLKKTIFCSSRARDFLHSIRNAGTYSTRPMPVALMPNPLVHLWLKSLISHIALPLVPGYSCASMDYRLASQPSLIQMYRVLPARISAPSAQPTLKNLPTTCLLAAMSSQLQSYML